MFDDAYQTPPPSYREHFPHDHEEYGRPLTNWLPGSKWYNDDPAFGLTKSDLIDWMKEHAPTCRHDCFVIADDVKAWCCSECGLRYWHAMFHCGPITWAPEAAVVMRPERHKQLTLFKRAA